MKLKTLAAGIGVLVLAASCSEDVTEEINSGPVISFTTRMSRAAEITNKSQITSFKVYAEAEGFDTPFINGDVAKKKGDNNYELDVLYRWPSSSSFIDFWAYAPSDIDVTKVNVSSRGASLQYEPKEYSSSVKNSGVEHKDLITAYTKATRTTSSGSSVSLNFSHALSQIQLNAKLGEGGSHYTVKIKGVWFVNVKSRGELSFTGQASGKNDFNWTFLSSDGALTPSKGVYGCEFNPVELDATGKGLLTVSNNSNLMLIPQALDNWNGEDDTKDGTTPYTDGAYILLLCRVEIQHLTNDDHSGPWVGDIDGGHIHQMFPTPKGGSTAYDEDLYGFVCVPLDENTGTWEAGKKYIYTLEFCGTNSGAGLYPPTLPDVFKGMENTTTGRADGKNVGDPVLDNPIKFTVSVGDWTNAWSGKPGDDQTDVNIPMN